MILTLETTSSYVNISMCNAFEAQIILSYLFVILCTLISRLLRNFIVVCITAFGVNNSSIWCTSSQLRENCYI